MPWKETCPMEERERFIKEWLSGNQTFKELCDQYGIHRSKGYKWRKRYLREGIAGLIERSRAPHRHPNQTPDEICNAIIELRRKHSRWGAAKLLRILARRHPLVCWPAASTAHEILRRADLIDAPKKRRRPGEYTSNLVGYYGPNAVWGADFKGYFYTLNKTRCNPLTISDLCSRYLLRCSALSRADTKQSKKVFSQAFVEYGLPAVIRTDNGAPFSSRCGLSALSVWWIKLGIRPERITRGRPTENSIHERIHKTMDDESATAHKRDLKMQQRCFDHFRKTYNEIRPHYSLGYKTPAEIYSRSERSYPKKLHSPQYPSDYQVYRVQLDGTIRFSGEHIYLSRLICNEPVGVRETESGHDVWYGPQLLGTINRKGQIRRGLPRGRPRHKRVPINSEEGLLTE